MVFPVVYEIIDIVPFSTMKTLKRCAIATCRVLVHRGLNTIMDIKISHFPILFSLKNSDGDNSL